MEHLPSPSNFRGHVSGHHAGGDRGQHGAQARSNHGKQPREDHEADRDGDAASHELHQKESIPDESSKCEVRSAKWARASRSPFELRTSTFALKSTEARPAPTRRSPLSTRPGRAAR